METFSIFENVAAFCKPVSGKHNNNQARLFALFD
jgi:hypothetical protein